MPISTRELLTILSLIVGNLATTLDGGAAERGVAATAPASIHGVRTIEKQPWWIVRKQDLIIPKHLDPWNSDENVLPWGFALLSRVEPYRFAHAEDWYSPYCKAWDDGYMVCSRASVEDKPKCSRIKETSAELPFQREVIECSAFDEKRLNEICSDTWTVSKYRFGFITCSNSECFPHERFPASIEQKDNPLWKYYVFTAGFTYPSNFGLPPRGKMNIICVHTHYSTRR